MPRGRASAGDGRGDGPLCPLQRVHLDIQVGEHTNNYPEIAAKDKLTELQLRARQLLDQVEQIQKEQNYQRVSGERGEGRVDFGVNPRGFGPSLTPLPWVRAVPGGAVPHDQREHEPARAVVVHSADHHPHPHRHLADEAPQELLRGQEVGVAPPPTPGGGLPQTHPHPPLGLGRDPCCLPGPRGGVGGLGGALPAMGGAEGPPPEVVFLGGGGEIKVFLVPPRVVGAFLGRGWGLLHSRHSAACLKGVFPAAGVGG